MSVFVLIFICFVTAFAIISLFSMLVGNADEIEILTAIIISISGIIAIAFQSINL